MPGARHRRKDQPFIGLPSKQDRRAFLEENNLYSTAAGRALEVIQAEPPFECPACHLTFETAGKTKRAYLREINRHLSINGTSTKELRCFTFSPMTSAKEASLATNAMFRKRREDLWKDLAPTGTCRPTRKGRETRAGSTVYLYECTRCGRVANFSHTTKYLCNDNDQSLEERQATKRSIRETDGYINATIDEERKTRRKSMLKEHNAKAGRVMQYKPKVYLELHPRKQLRIICWNVGSAVKHSADLIGILCDQRPHILCLQEAKAKDGNLRALQTEARAIGYGIYASQHGELAVYVMNGIYFIPLKQYEGDERFLFARYGADTACERIFICNNHGHPSNASERTALLNHLDGHAQGELVCITGDFNEKPEPPGHFQARWPKENTFRLNKLQNNYSSSLDGTMVSKVLVDITTTDVSRYQTKTQHRPIVTNIAMNVLPRGKYAWRQGAGGCGNQWSDQQKQEFICKATIIRDRLSHTTGDNATKNIQDDIKAARNLKKDIDLLWNLWLLNCGGPCAHFELSRRWGGMDNQRLHPRYQKTPRPDPPPQSQAQRCT